MLLLIQYHPVDKFVHEFCKLFGTPEYGSGANNFPDFLALMINDHTLSDESRQYFLAPHWTCSGR